MQLRVPPWSWDPAILGLLLWKHREIKAPSISTDDTQYKTINIFHNKVCEGMHAKCMRGAKMAWKYAACAYFYSFGAFPRSVGIFSTTRLLQRNLLCSISLCVHILQWGYLWPTWAWHEKHNKTEQGSFWGYFMTFHILTLWVVFAEKLSFIKKCC